MNLGGVGGAFGCRAGDGGVQDRRVERAGEWVQGEDVVPGVADPGRRFGDRVENLLDDWADRVGFHNSATGYDLGFYAARSYSLMRPPRTGRRLIRWRERSATG